MQLDKILKLRRENLGPNRMCKNSQCKCRWYKLRYMIGIRNRRLQVKIWYKISKKPVKIYLFHKLNILYLWLCKSHKNYHIMNIFLDFQWQSQNNLFHYKMCKKFLINTFCKSLDRFYIPTQWLWDWLGRNIGH